MSLRRKWKSLIDGIVGTATLQFQTYGCNKKHLDTFMSKTIRAACAQFHVDNNVTENLATCLRMIRLAAEQKPDLLVLPEFSNHCSWYDNAAHCFEVSVDIDGEFLSDIAQAAREIETHVVINCTVRRGSDAVTGTSLLFAPDGSLLGTTDKQVLIGHENDFLQRSTQPGPVVNTLIGRLAMYSCMDGVINETPRCLALRGADILCNSLNSFALDEGNLHIPVRAAENKVWVVASNKVGPLIPEAIVGPVSEAINIPADCLNGAGDSQIVAPDGTVLAIAGKGEEIVFADIDPTLARAKYRPDGTDIFLSRRPELYAPLAEDPESQVMPDITGPDAVLAAVINLDPAASAAADEAVTGVSTAIERGAALVCLPALTGVHPDPGTVETSSAFIEQLSTSLPDNVIVATSIAAKTPAGLQHQATLVDKTGVVLRQDLLHATSRYSWSATGDTIQFLDTGYGRIGVLCGDDAMYPEIFRLYAMAGVSTILIPSDFLESWETATGITERSAENRINLVAASRDISVITTLQNDFTIMTPWKEREFDGLLSAPEAHRFGDAGVNVVEIHPLAAANKECSSNTHLVESRPWQLLEAIT